MTQNRILWLTPVNYLTAVKFVTGRNIVTKLLKGRKTYFIESGNIIYTAVTVTK